VLPQALLPLLPPLPAPLVRELSPAPPAMLVMLVLPL